MTVNSNKSSLRKCRRYPAYKDSGIEWVGKIPAHWEVKRTKTVFRLIADHAPEGNEEELLSIYTDIGVRPRKELEPKGNKATTTDSYFYVKKGDLIVNKLLAWMGAIGVSNYDGVTSPAYDILRKRNSSTNTNYYHFLFRSGMYSSMFRSRSRGIMDMRLRLYFEEFGQISIPFPPLDEQSRIVAFLDRETAKIDTLIAKKERLIELLQEKRTALISHAVTKGLDASVPMKDSGVEWLGMVPAHWLVCHQKYLWKRCDYGISESLSGTGEIRVLTMGHIREGEIVVPELGCVNDVPPILFLEKHDLLFNRTNSLELVGKVGLFRGDREERICFASYLVRLRVNQKANAMYLNYLLNCPGFLRAAQSLALPSINQANLNATRYGNITVAVPTPDEQGCIMDYLDRETAKIDSLINLTQTTIDKLREYRTALISAAVTGKIDVREEVL